MSALRDVLRQAKDIRCEKTSDIDAEVVQDAISQLATKRLAKSVVGQKNGIASLDGSGKVPAGQLPGDFVDPNAVLTKLKTVDGPGSGLNADLVDGKQATDFVLTNAISTSVASTSTTNVASSSAAKACYDKAESALTLVNDKNTEYQNSFEKISARNKANGYPGLDSKGFLSPNILPSATIVNVFTYTDTGKRNAYTSHHKGDMAIIEKSGKADLFILKTDPAGKETTDANWLTLQTSVTIDVRSWNGRNGDVMPSMGDYTSNLITHKGKKLDGFLDSLETGIPDSDFYSKSESDSRFLAQAKLSDVVNSTDPNGIASTKAAKTAYDRGTEGINAAKAKLDKATADTLYLTKSGKAADADKLDGKNSTDFIFKTAISDSVSSDSNSTVASSKAAKLAHDTGNEALTRLSSKLDKTAKAADADKLDGNDSSYFSNASNLSSGTVPAERLPAYRLITSNQTLKAFDKALVDLTKGNIVVTLPASPQAGQYVVVMDASGLADSKVLTMGRNGQNIMGKPEDLTFNIKGYQAHFVFFNSARGWVLA